MSRSPKYLLAAVPASERPDADALRFDFAEVVGWFAMRGFVPPAGSSSFCDPARGSLPSNMRYAPHPPKLTALPYAPPVFAVNATHADLDAVGQAIKAAIDERVAYALRGER